MTQPVQHSALLIAARPGLWRDALESYLEASPELDVRTVGDGASKLFASLDCCTPDLLLLDADLCPAELVGTLVRIRDDYPGLVCIVIVDTYAQFQASRIIGPGLVVMKSMLHDQLDGMLSAIKRKEE